VLDQPSQVYSSQNDVKNEITSADKKALDTIFNVLKDVVNKLNGKLQTIVLEHTTPSDKELQGKVKHHWTEHDALIPTSWIR
jgi:hypothetical protein